MGGEEERAGAKINTRAMAKAGTAKSITCANNCNTKKQHMPSSRSEHQRKNLPAWRSTRVQVKKPSPHANKKRRNETGNVSPWPKRSMTRSGSLSGQRNRISQGSIAFKSIDTLKQEMASLQQEEISAKTQWE